MARRARTTKPKPDFHKQTVLFQWALSKFGVRDLPEFRERFQIGPNSQEGFFEGRHRFFHSIIQALPATGDGLVAPDRLQEYEQNLVEHTEAINSARAQHNQPKVDWKYHQYLSLLFTEMFLDRYFTDPAPLRNELNQTITAHNEAVGGPESQDFVQPFPIEPAGNDPADPREQLSRLAFWCATGSGKTLLMHVHIRQFRQYHARAFKSGLWPKLDQIILVTPNDGLSTQHKTELTQSGFDAVSIEEAGVDGLFATHAQQAIKILSIHKFRDDHGKATVATEAFEGCNLVLVDEGHRGAGSGGEGAWLSRRNQLAEGGFTFEYSATFKEAIAGDEEMQTQYARSILFDYSYRSFYRDGYGKDFTILNLDADDDDKAEQRRYLTAALLLFYQQLRVWEDGGERIKPFQIEKPLWVFVGHTVTGGKVSNKEDKVSVSDVVEVLQFIKGFLTDPTESVRTIRDLLECGFVDHRGEDLLEHRLPHLDTSGDKPGLARSIHEGILRDIFNAPGGGALAVQLLRGATGEMALKVGEGEPFGVVNVGDPVAVVDACEQDGITRLEDDSHRPSLFHGINRDDSSINLLVGSRKFTEGWNSWRVSSIGLMRLGKGEGTQIIQLFGRGVRLRGYRMSLRRSSALSHTPPKPDHLRQVETLQVFGVKAAYMERFRHWIYEEVPEAEDKRVWDLPVVTRKPWPKLRTIKLKDVIEGVQVERGQAFRKLGPLVRLRPPHETAPEDAWLRHHSTRLNWLPRIRGISGEGGKVGTDVGQAAELPRQSLRTIPAMFFDIDALLFGLEAFKATRGLDRLHADRRAIAELLARDDWYVLFATPDDLRMDRWENRTQWQRMAQQLLNAYAERFYRFLRGRWEAPYIEVAEIQEDDPGILTGYTVETTELARSADEIERIAAFVTDLKAALTADSLAHWSQDAGRWRTLPFSGHLYQPLLHVGKNMVIRISPVALDKHEAQFVEDLARWCARNPGREVFLLRNQAVTGLGFFQAANFFPDFLLWVQDHDQEHLAFVDPKGLYHFEPTDPKVQFASRDVPRLQAIIDRQTSGLLLHGFILSNTPFTNLDWTGAAGERMSKAQIESLGVLFQADDAATYVDTLMRRIGDGATQGAIR